MACFGVYVSTFFILSPTDYQSILAELQSPAALHSDPHFLEPELPITPNPSLAHQQHHHYPEPDTPLLAESQPQPLPWSLEIEYGSKEPDSPPRSPPRPCELSLSVPAPDPVPYKVRKPHIALNDQLLLSEEEDRSYHEMEPSCKPKSHSFPPMYELDIDMAYSTSSPSLSPVSSITPSSPDRAQIGERVVLIDAPNGVQEDVGMKEGKKEVTEEIKKVASELIDGNGLVEKWVEQNLIKNVERKCEMITKDMSKLEEKCNLLVEQKEGSAEEEKDVKDKQYVSFQYVAKGTACEVVQLKDVQNLSEEQCDLIEIEHEVEKSCTAIEAVTVKEDTEEVQTINVDNEERLNEADKMDGTEVELQFKDEEGLCGTERDICRISEGNQTAGHQDEAAGRLSPQAWVEALRELQPSEFGFNNEEEEEDRDKGITEETFESLLEEVKKEESSEEKGEDEEMTATRVQEILYQVEQTEKDVCSISGWHSDSSSINVEPPTPGRSVSSDLLNRRER